MMTPARGVAFSKVAGRQRLCKGEEYGRHQYGRCHWCAPDMQMVFGDFGCPAGRRSCGGDFLPLDCEADETLVRSSTFVGMVASIVAVASLICLGPMSTLIGLTMESSTVSEATTEDAKQVAERIAEEGFVLLKNDDDTLPLKSVKKLNLFGWASENPTYSGGGSGGINENYEVISLRQGLEHAGFSVNPGLAKFYASYTSDRPEMTIQKQSWTLPEPAISTYSDSLLEQAKAYSDVAVITLTRGPAKEPTICLPI